MRYSVGLRGVCQSSSGSRGVTSDGPGWKRGSRVEWIVGAHGGGMVGAGPLEKGVRGGRGGVKIGGWEAAAGAGGWLGDLRRLRFLPEEELPPEDDLLASLIAAQVRLMTLVWVWNRSVIEVRANRILEKGMGSRESGDRVEGGGRSPVSDPKLLSRYPWRISLMPAASPFPARSMSSSSSRRDSARTEGTPRKEWLDDSEGVSSESGSVG